MAAQLIATVVSLVMISRGGQAGRIGGEVSPDMMARDRADLLVVPAESTIGVALAMTVQLASSADPLITVVLLVRRDRISRVLFSLLLRLPLELQHHSSRLLLAVRALLLAVCMSCPRLRRPVALRC